MDNLWEVEERPGVYGGGIFTSGLNNESGGWLKDDCMIIRATITLGDTTARTPHSPGMVAMRSDYTELHASGDGSDVILCCGDKEFACHRTILRARSPYFRGLFASTMSDADR